MQEYSQYGSYTIREDTDLEDYVYWSGGTLDDKGEDRLEKNDPLKFDPRMLPVGTIITISVPTDSEGLADWPQFKKKKPAISGNFSSAIKTITGL